MNRKCDMKKELKTRVADTMAVMKRLGLFWSQARCPIKFKIQVYNAVIRTKATYGLEGAHVDEASYTKLNALHLKGLRKILGMKTTYIDRKSNKEVYTRASRRAEMEEGS